MAHRVMLMPDYGPYFGTLDGQAVTAASQIPVSEEMRHAIEQWWHVGYGNFARPNIDEDRYETFTQELAARLQDELGPEWEVTWQM